MVKEQRTGLYWFTRDLRLDDMPALIKLNSVVDSLILVYVFDEQLFKTAEFGWSRMGPHRKQFIEQGLGDLRAQLDDLGQHLLVLNGDTINEIARLCEQYAVSDIGATTLDGVYEQRTLSKIKQKCPLLRWHMQTQETLFGINALPMALESVDNTFTPWRKKIEDVVSPIAPEAVVKSLKPPVFESNCQQNSEPTAFLTKDWHGGERFGLAQLDYYFEGSQHLSQYKVTRNGMLGWDFSSKFSAWLASGMLSPRRVASRIVEYEENVEKNESTYWLYFELLWREFFHLQLKKHGHLFFAAGGFKQHNPNLHYDKTEVRKWCDGNTGCDIVDAGMRQLNTTGFLSNRARQLCASYLIHELNQHWRYGAAYFEYMLIDYDVASNWGNWLYLAGGGSDPRGQRKFDIAAQTERYDPHREFIDYWLR